MAPTFEQSLEDCTEILGLFVKNQFKSALMRCEKWCDHSLMHSHGKSLLLSLSALLTIEQKEIETAIESCNQTLEMCQKLRRNDSIARYVRKTNYDELSEEQIHAELVHAEELLMTALLTFFADQNILSLVKGANRLRLSNNAYKECLKILVTRTKWTNQNSRLQFESGYRFGWGLLNLVFSHLPRRVLLMLEFFGFSGSKPIGLKQLNSVSETSLRYFPAILAIFGYECYAKHLFGIGNTDLVVADRIVRTGLEFYDKSAIFVWFKARLLQLSGKVDDAIHCFNECINTQTEVKSLYSICYWELIWCYALKCEWDSAAKYSQLMVDECQWARSMTTYQKASFLYMKMIDENRPEMRKEVTELFRQVPTLRRRVAGKTIPPEKYACTNAELYFRQRENLALPAFKLFQMWNVMEMASGDESLINPILSRINRSIIATQNANSNSVESYLSLLYLRGVCLKELRKYSESIKCFTEVLKNEKHVTLETNILPESALQIGLIKLKLNAKDEAKSWLKKARKDYSGYLLETAIHFRVHCALMEIKCTDQD